MEREKLVNLIALKEVFFENKKNEIKDTKQFLIEVKRKNDIDVVYEVEKENVEQTLIDIFSNNNITEAKSVELYYISKNEKKFINGISIF